MSVHVQVCGCKLCEGVGIHVGVKVCGCTCTGVSGPHCESHYPSTGAVAVVTSLECLDWLEDLLNELMVPGEDIRPHYRGMPLVILAVDGHPKEGTVYKTCLFHSYIVHVLSPSFPLPSLYPSLPLSLPPALPPPLCLLL